MNRLRVSLVAGLAVLLATVPAVAVSKKWGTGLYTVTIEATNTSGDTATASASITID
jgi:hypothetical protein